jgi:hypothetical protein
MRCKDTHADVPYKTPSHAYDEVRRFVFEKGDLEML